jgi:hypothetical protein
VASHARASGARLRSELDRSAVAVDDPQRRVIAIQFAQLDAARRLLDGDRSAGQSMLEAVARDEDSLPAAFGPPQVDEPTRELLGRMMVPSEPAQARKQFERALVLDPGRVDATRGLLRATRALGDVEQANAIEARLNETLRHADALAQGR